MAVLNETFSVVGVDGNSVKVFASPIIEQRAPLATDVAEEGRVWIDTLNQDAYVCVNTGSTSVWINSGGGDGIFDNLTVNNDATIGNDLSVTNIIFVRGSALPVISVGDANSATGERGAIDINCSTNNVSPGIINFTKSRLGGPVNTGDNLGALTFGGYDSASIPKLAGQIQVVASGTIGATKVPSIMGFTTADDLTGALHTRMTIDEDGQVTINTPTVGTLCLLTNGDVYAQQLSASGDNGAVLAQTSFTNVDVTSAPGGAKLTIDSQSANPGVNAGFIKVYVGASTAYIPYFTNISP